MKISVFLLISRGYLFFMLVEQQESYEGYWIESYEEWSFDVNDGYCCGKEMISKDNARYLRVTSDSIFMLKDNEVLQKSAYSIDKYGIKTDFERFSFYDGGLESDGRGACARWFHFVRVD